MPVDHTGKLSELEGSNSATRRGTRSEGCGREEARGKGANETVENIRSAG